jgi:hypothetical protein
MFNKENFFKFLNNIESLYNSGISDYINFYLKKLSNNSKIITNYDRSTINFCYVDANFLTYEMFILKNIFDSEFETNQNVNITNMYSWDFNDLKIIRLRDIFGYNNLTDIDKIIKYTIRLSKNNKLINLFDKKYDKFESLFYYLKNLFHNLEILMLYFYDDNKILNLDIPFDSLINNNNNDKLHKYDLDFELDKLDINNYFDKTYELKDNLSIEATEESEIKKAKDFREKLKNIGKLTIRITTAVNNGKNKINHFLDKLNVIRNLFYKKNIGKIDHLYKNYASSSTILENELHGDPVKILMNKVPSYMNYIIDNITKIYNNYNKHIDKLMDSKSLKDMIEQVNKYLTYDEVKLETTATSKDINKALKLDLRYKFAKILLKDNDVYGFTVESIVNKKYPLLNHLIVSLFIPRPHEKPTEQSVSDIFEDADSFKIMSRKFKDIILQISTLINKKISTIDVEKNFKNVYSNINQYKQMHSSDKSRFTDTKNSDTIDKDSDKEFKKDLKQRISVLKNHEHLLQSFIPIFIYIANTSSVIYEIAIRIDKTAQDAIKSMLNTEKSRSDKGYKTGTSGVSKNEYKTSTNPTPEKTKTAKQSIKSEVEKQSITDSGNLVSKVQIK